MGWTGRTRVVAEENIRGAELIYFSGG